MKQNWQLTWHLAKAKDSANHRKDWLKGYDANSNLTTRKKLLFRILFIVTLSISQTRITSVVLPVVLMGSNHHSAKCCLVVLKGNLQVKFDSTVGGLH